MGICRVTYESIVRIAPFLACVPGIRFFGIDSSKYCTGRKHPPATEIRARMYYIGEKEHLLILSPKL